MITNRNKIIDFADMDDKTYLEDFVHKNYQNMKIRTKLATNLEVYS